MASVNFVVICSLFLATSIVSIDGLSCNLCAVLTEEPSWCNDGSNAEPFDCSNMKAKSMLMLNALDWDEEFLSEIAATGSSTPKPDTWACGVITKSANATNIKATIRTCLPQGTCKGPYSALFDTCTECTNEDYCNSSSALTYSLMAFVISFALKLIL